MIPLRLDLPPTLRRCFAATPGGPDARHQRADHCASGLSSWRCGSMSDHRIRGEGYGPAGPPHDPSTSEWFGGSSVSSFVNKWGLRYATVLHTVKSPFLSHVTTGERPVLS